MIHKYQPRRKIIVFRKNWGTKIRPAWFQYAHPAEDNIETIRLFTCVDSFLCLAGRCTAGKLSGSVCSAVVQSECVVAIRGRYCCYYYWKLLLLLHLHCYVGVVIVVGRAGEQCAGRCCGWGERCCCCGLWSLLWGGLCCFRLGRLDLAGKEFRPEAPFSSEAGLDWDKVIIIVSLDMKSFLCRTSVPISGGRLLPVFLQQEKFEFFHFLFLVPCVGVGFLSAAGASLFVFPTAFPFPYSIHRFSGLNLLVFCFFNDITGLAGDSPLCFLGSSFSCLGP